MMKTSVRWLVGRLLDARAWRPRRARLLWRQVSGRELPERIQSDDVHMRAAARWVARAQDVVDDGGICGRFLLDTGWTSSYPETTGYLIPTLLELSQATGDPEFRERAERCVEFLLGLQLKSGAFPGGEVHENTKRPSTFNTAQILSGLTAWEKAVGDPRVLDAADRAAQWLVAMQEDDGSWSRHVYMDTPVTYMAHAACWLADFGAYVGQEPLLEAAGHHLDWVLSHRDPQTGWFDRCGFGKEDHAQRQAYTHTIGYTLFGILRLAEILDRGDGLEALEKGGVAAARRLELSRWLPGVLDHRWKGRADFTCLTGNAQMAQFWMCLYRHTGDDRLVNAALKALDLVKGAQVMNSGDPNLDGAIAGSDPIWGGYIYNGFPNWAPKFFIDALLEKQRVLGELERRPPAEWTLPSDVPREVPPVNGPEGARDQEASLRIVLLTRPGSHKVPQMVSKWSQWGFRPSAVIVERLQTQHSVQKRVNSRVRKVGLSGLAGSALGKIRLRKTSTLSRASDSRPSSVASDPVAYCRDHDIPVVEVPSLESPEGVSAVEALRPDLAVYAGAGILRAPLLSVIRLGTLNAHMGVLPFYRGMNVTEWAAFRGDPVGCSVHVIDPGIDTGDIVAVRLVDHAGVSTVTGLRTLVDEEQIALLGHVVRFVQITGRLPPLRPQDAQEGRQFFRMHTELAELLERTLARSGGPA